MVIVVRKDAKLTKRELATHVSMNNWKSNDFCFNNNSIIILFLISQCVNASVEAFKRSLLINPDLVKQWQRWGQMKVAVKVNSESDLLAVKNEADKNALVNYLVRDSDRAKSSALVLAIGPDSIEDINVVTGHLKLLWYFTLKPIVDFSNPMKILKIPNRRMTFTFSRVILFKIWSKQ